MNLLACIDCLYFKEIKSTAYGWCRVSKEKKDSVFISGYEPACDRLKEKE